MRCRCSLWMTELSLALTLQACGAGGKHMTQPNPPSPSNPNAFVGGVAWCGTQFVAVAGMTGVGGIIITSPDGITWKAKAPGTFGLNGVARFGTQSAVVAVGVVGTILTSPDGATWTPQTSGTAANLDWAAWSGTQLVAVGASGTILTSPDGVSWAPRTSSTGNELFGVASSGAQFVVTGDSGTILRTERRGHAGLRVPQIG